MTPTIARLRTDAEMFRREKLPGTANLMDEAATELAQLHAAVRAMHAAKGRHNTQRATAELYQLCGLPEVFPESTKRGQS